MLLTVRKTRFLSLFFFSIFCLPNVSQVTMWQVRKRRKRRSFQQESARLPCNLIPSNSLSFLPYFLLLVKHFALSLLLPNLLVLCASKVKEDVIHLIIFLCKKDFLIVLFLCHKSFVKILSSVKKNNV